MAQNLHSIEENKLNKKWPLKLKKEKEVRSSEEHSWWEAGLVMDCDSHDIPADFTVNNESELGE